MEHSIIIQPGFSFIILLIMFSCTQECLLRISFYICWMPLGSTLWDYMHLAYMFVELLGKSW